MVGKLSILLFAFIPLIYSGTWQVNTNFKIDYQVSGQDIKFTFTLTGGKTGWMGICFNEFMYPADCIICQFSGGTPQCLDTYNPGIKNAPFYPAPVVDTYSPGTGIGLNINTVNGFGQQNLASIVGTNVNNVITIQVSRKLSTGDKYDEEIICGNTYKVIGAYHDTTLFSTTPGSAQTKHSATGSGTIKFC